MSFAKSWLLPFSLGAASALALVWFGNKSYDDNSKRDSSVAARKKVYPTENTSNKNENDAKEEEELMDRPDLDQRMLRKAEAVIQWRTTRLVVVVERCTNDYNYSAILRTAEALGIQIIYMIDPPEVDYEGRGEANRIASQVQVRRTEEEIKE